MAETQWINSTVAIVVTLYALGMLGIALLRYWQTTLSNPPLIATYASGFYIVLTVAGAVLLTRLNVPLNQLGFAPTRHWLQLLGLGLLGVVVLQLLGWILAPVWDVWFGQGRDLNRFAELEGSLPATIRLLVLNWTFAAVGEELAFRIILMGSLIWLLANIRGGVAIAVLIQALVFGLIHAYQGPAGVAGSFVSGLVFGGLVVVGRHSIWPAALAHGGNNTIGILQLYLGV